MSEDLSASRSALSPGGFHGLLDRIIPNPSRLSFQHLVAVRAVTTTKNDCAAISHGCGALPPELMPDGGVQSTTNAGPLGPYDRVPQGSSLREEWGVVHGDPAGGRTQALAPTNQIPERGNEGRGRRVCAGAPSLSRPAHGDGDGRVRIVSTQAAIQHQADREDVRASLAGEVRVSRSACLSLSLLRVVSFVQAEERTSP